MIYERDSSTPLRSVQNDKIIMEIEEYKTKFHKPLRQRTLCFLIKDNKVLLGMKKRGFGQGKYAGIGGKLEQGETSEQAAIREVKEEIGVDVENLRRVASTNNYFPYVTDQDSWNQAIAVYLVDKWQGEILETDEIMPQWFDIKNIPLDKMWSDAKLWLPQILQGKILKADFLFDSDLQVEDYSII